VDDLAALIHKLKLRRVHLVGVPYGAFTALALALKRPELVRSLVLSGLSAPSPAMTKAFLMNSAAYMTGAGAGGNLQSNSQGMGRMDLARAFDGAQRLVVDPVPITFAICSSTSVCKNA
jgi:pimeloyl-ACP methyl ester carboxylesterase